MIARKKKQKVLALRAGKARDELTDQIDPVLGDYKPSAESSASGARAGRRRSASAAVTDVKPSKWDQSLLKQVVVDRNDIWYSPPPQYPSSYDLSEVAGREFPFPAPVQPRYFSPILSSEADRQFVLRSVPEASVEIASSSEVSLEAQAERMESETAKQLERSEMLMRALDLRNSDSRGIRVSTLSVSLKRLGQRMVSSNRVTPTLAPPRFKPLFSLIAFACWRITLPITRGTCTTAKHYVGL